MGIHRFASNGRYIVFDVNSSSVFDVDKPTYEVLELYPKLSQTDIYQHFRGVHSQKTLAEIIAEIDELITMGCLFTKNPPLADIQAAASSYLKALCLNITHDCNLSCRYCFASGGDFNMKNEFMSIDTAMAAIDFLVARSGPRKNLEVDFFGGEPLMNFSVLRNTVSYARSLEEKTGKRFRFTVTTNAVLITDEILDYFNEEIDNVVLSVDGRKKVNDNMRILKDGEGSYDIAIGKIMRAVASREDRSFYIRSTYTAENLDFADDVAHLAHLGFMNLSCEPVVASPAEPYAIRQEHLSRIVGEYDRLAEFYLNSLGTDHEFSFFHFKLDLDSATCYYKRLSGCGAGSEYLAVTPSGDIYPCHQFVGIDNFLMGSVLSNRVSDKISENFRSVNFLNKKECASCWSRFYCGGGCYANAYKASGEIDGSYPLGCEMLKKRMESALYIKCVEKSLSSNEK